MLCPPKRNGLTEDLLAAGMLCTAQTNRLRGVDAGRTVVLCSAYCVLAVGYVLGVVLCILCVDFWICLGCCVVLCCAYYVLCILCLMHIVCYAYCVLCILCVMHIVYCVMFR